MACRKFVKNYLWQVQFQGKFEDKEFVKSIWNGHHDEVQNYVDKNQLLVYNLNQGWKPLCNFLGVAIPSGPIPHLNKKEDFNAMMQSMLLGKKVKYS